MVPHQSTALSHMVHCWFIPRISRCGQDKESWTQRKITQSFTFSQDRKPSMRIISFALENDLCLFLCCFIAL